MSSRSEKLRRRQRRKEKKQRRSTGLVPPLGGPDHLVVNLPGAVKMSEVILTLVEPEWDLCHDQEAAKKLLTLGITAWNAALMSGAKGKAFLEDLAQTFPVDLRQDFFEIVERFIRRKEELFPHIQRPIISFDLDWRPSGQPYLRVISRLA